jgi:hypothetical protein
VAVPMEKDGTCACTNGGNNIRSPDQANLRAKALSTDPPWGG